MPNRLYRLVVTKHLPDFGHIVADLTDGRDLWLRSHVVSIINGQIPVVVLIKNYLATVTFLNSNEDPIKRSSEFMSVDLVIGHDSSFGHVVGQSAQAGDASIRFAKQHP